MEAFIRLNGSTVNYPIIIDSKEIEDLIGNIQCNDFFQMKGYNRVKISAIAHIDSNSRIFYCMPWNEL